MVVSCNGLTGTFENSSPINTSDTSKHRHPNTSGMWMTAYLGAWNHYAPPGGNWGNIKTDQIDWSAFTQMDYFALNANPDGSLSKIAPYQTFSPSRLNAIVAAAHKAGKPILFTVGGWGNHPGFTGAISAANRSTFIHNLIDVLKTWKFDGIDLDMEPINNSDISDYSAFVKDLNEQLQQIHTPLLDRPMLTAATDWQPAMFANIQQYFDQINLMTYDMSGPWGGWVSWFNSPVFDGGLTFSNGKPLPSVNQEVKRYTAQGVKKSKIGIGIDFYGYIWTGVTGPNQSWITPPQVKPNVPYYQIMDSLYSSNDYHWDKAAESAYLSKIQLNVLGVVTLKQFISYDDKQSIKAKINYVRNHDIGGAIIWELGGGFRKNQPVGQKDELLQTVKKYMNEN